VTNFQTAKQANDTLQASISEARGIIKDLKQLKKEVESFISKEYKEYIEAELKRHLDRIGEKSQQTMHECVDKVIAEFDKLTRDFMGDGTEERPSIDQMLRAKVKEEVARRHRR
jgi:hypothetical protein